MSPGNKDDQIDPVTKRLDAILAIYVRSLHPDSISDQIRALDGTGLGPSEIGHIVGRDGGYVSTILARKPPKSGKVKKG
jgi:hypothetical protein